MATLKFLIDVKAPDARRTFDAVTARLDKLDKTMERTRKLSVGDKSAMAAVTRIRLAADKLRERVEKPMDMSLRGAQSAEARLLEMEATADRLDRKLRKAGGPGLLSRLGGLGRGAAGVAGGLSKGGGIATAATGLAGGAAALSVPFIAATAAVGAFSALAIPTLSKVTSAMGKTGKAGKKAMAALDPSQRGIAKSIKALETTFDKMAKSFEPVVASVVGGASKLAQAFLPALKPLAKAGASVIHSFLGPLTHLAKSPAFAKFAKTLASVAVEAGKLLGPFLARLLKTFMGLVTALAPAGLKLLKVLEPLVNGILKALTPVLAAAAGAMVKLVEALTPLLKPAAQLLLALTPIIGVAADLVTALTPLINLLANLLAKAITNGLVPVLNKILVPALEWVAKKAVWLSGHWKRAWADIKHWLWDAWHAMDGDVFQPIERLFTKLIPGWLDGAVGWFKALPGRLLHALGNLAKLLYHKGLDLLRGLLNGELHGWKMVAGWLAGTAKRILGYYAKAGSWLYHAGLHLIGGLKNGIVAAFKGIGGWIKRVIVDPVVNWVKHWFGIKSPSTVMAWVGSHLMGGLFKGMLAHDVPAMVKKIFGSLPGALGAIVDKGLAAIGQLPAKALHALGSLGSKGLSLLGKGASWLGHLFGGGGGGGNANVRLGQSMAAAFGWTGRQWQALDMLWNRESGWRTRARNPSSGAYGIPQALPPSKMASAGADWATNPATQIKWGLEYILGRYGSPLKAWAHETAFGWYGHGGTFRAGQLIGVGDRGPELVSFNRPGRVFSPEQSAALVAAASKGSDGGTFTGELFLDSGEFLGMVRGEIRRDEQETIRAIRAGTGSRR